jgi:hypothetical protein
MAPALLCVASFMAVEHDNCEHRLLDQARHGVFPQRLAAGAQRVRQRHHAAPLVWFHPR